MKRTQVQVRWTQGLHLRPAARLVRLGQQFRSTIRLQVGRRSADLRSILGIIGLCAMLGTTVEIQASGEDEDLALQAVERAFTTDSDDAARSDQEPAP